MSCRSTRPPSPPLPEGCISFCSISSALQDTFHLPSPFWMAAGCRNFNIRYPLPYILIRQLRDSSEYEAPHSASSSSCAEAKVSKGGAFWLLMHRNLVDRNTGIKAIVTPFLSIEITDRQKERWGSLPSEWNCFNSIIQKLLQINSEIHFRQKSINYTVRLWNPFVWDFLLLKPLLLLLYCFNDYPKFLLHTKRACGQNQMLTTSTYYSAKPSSSLSSSSTSCCSYPATTLLFLVLLLLRGNLVGI